MKNKTKDAHFLTSFVAMVHKQFDYHVKHIRSDNGTEFIAKKLQHFYQENEIIQQFSCISTPR